MHKGCISKIVSIVFLLVMSGLACAAEPTNPIATVNGIDLTAGELNQEMQLIAPMEASFHGTMSQEKIREIEQKALNTLVEKELQYQDGLEKGLNIPSNVLKDEIQQVAARYETLAEYNKALKSAGFTEKTLSRFLERNTVSEKMRKREVDDKVVVSDEAVRRHYDENKARYFKPAEYRASQIMVKVDPSLSREQKGMLRERAELLLKKVQDGADFSQVAEAESDDMSRIKGGDLGFFHAGVTESEFDDAIKQMKVGEIRGPVETIYGFHIIKLVDKKETHQIEFDEIKAKIKSQLLESEKKRLFNQWMGLLKGKAKIVYLLRKVSN